MATEKEREIRQQLTKTGQRLVEKNLVAGPGGNISVRDGRWVYLSPSGFALDEIKPEEWVKVDLVSGHYQGKWRPTCEISMHLGLYLARTDIRAIVHTHPAITTGLVSGGITLRPIFPDFVAILGHAIPVVDYVIPAGEAIRKAVVAALKRANVATLKNHGAVCLGSTLYEAFVRSWVLEESARMLLAALVAGKPRYLSAEEIEGIDHLEAEDYRKTLLKNR
ncbi:MAG TPA: class II aldolase/adducin family protein [bacterium]|nr:class II aldolase/adducin family protein [bacterium]HPP11861.1 class II aldolase/adducin family protein [bacterium]